MNSELIDLYRSFLRSDSGRNKPQPHDRIRSVPLTRDTGHALENSELTDLSVTFSNLQLLASWHSDCDCEHRTSFSPGV
jgi:hypothetical protein